MYKKKIKISDRTDLERMFLALKDSPRIYFPSKHWKRLNNKHTELLVKNGGLSNFKRTVNFKYFNWNIWGILFHQLTPFFDSIFNRNFDFVNSSNYGKSDLLPGKSLKTRLFNYFYSRYVAALYEYVKRIDRLEILNKISEPRLGNPLLVKYKNKLLSQDLCNSVHEFYSIYNNIEDFSQINNIAEIGAGYGRLTYIFLKILSRKKYFIIDIPPALYIAQEYLERVFPDKKIFKFQRFESYTEISSLIEKSDVIFLMPYQINLLPNKLFDQTINISSLHEMKSDQINNYFRQINRLTKRYFYSKQWKRSIVKDNNYIKMEKYPVPKGWKEIFCRTHPVQKLFFEALYKIY